MSALTALFSALLLAASTGTPHVAPSVDAAPLGYTLPEVGSYELPVIDRVSEHMLIDSAGDSTPVLGAPPDGCAIISFVYLHCADATGCPLSLATLQRLDHALAARPELNERVRLVTVSFDPVHDDPAAMASLRHHMSPRTGWRFLTAKDAAQLAPVLADYGQDAVAQLTADGREAGVFQHVAKIFLVDPEGGIRNVYSAGFLDHRLLLLDVETLLAEP